MEKGFPRSVTREAKKDLAVGGFISFVTVFELTKLMFLWISRCATEPKDRLIEI